MTNVTVYVKPQCVQCDQTKKFLEKNNIPYSTVDLTQNADAMQKVVDLGFASAPVVITDNDQWAGFKHVKLTALVESYSK